MCRLNHHIILKMAFTIPPYLFINYLCEYFTEFDCFCCDQHILTCITRNTIVYLCLHYNASMIFCGMLFVFFAIITWFTHIKCDFNLENKTINILTLKGHYQQIKKSYTLFSNLSSIIFNSTFACIENLKILVFTVSLVKLLFFAHGQKLIVPAWLGIDSFPLPFEAPHNLPFNTVQCKHQAVELNTFW